MTKETPLTEALKGVTLYESEAESFRRTHPRPIREGFKIIPNREKETDPKVLAVMEAWEMASTGTNKKEGKKIINNLQEAIN